MSVDERYLSGNGARSATHDLHDAVETTGASRNYEYTFAEIIRASMHALSEKAFPWVTLMLVTGAFFFVAYTIATNPDVKYTPLIVAFAIFAALTHVPTWALWKRGR